MGLFRAYFGAIALSMGLVNPSLSQAQDHVINLYEFHIHESSDFFGKTLSQIGTEEFAGILTAACAAFAVDCSTLAAGVQQGAHILSEDYISQGENYRITGNVTRQEGEEWSGFFTGLTGYEVCKAGLLDYGNMGISGGSTFNVSVYRNGTNTDTGFSILGFYAVVPKNRGRGEGIDAILAIDWVPNGMASNMGCFEDKSHPWLCKGQDCNPLNRM